MKTTIGFAITGSFCTFDKVFAQMEELVRRGYELLPILSYSASRMDTRFYTAAQVLARVTEITGHEPMTTLQQVEPLGPKRMTDAYVIAPATGNTLAKLAAGIFDTPVLLGAKSHLRVEKPLILAVSTNDGLSSAAENIGKLLGRKHIYFVPFLQDDPFRKPRSIVAQFDVLARTVSAAICGVQLQPILAYPDKAGAHETALDAAQEQA